MGGIGPFFKKAPFHLYFRVIFRFHFSKSNQKVKQKVAEKELKMATVNDPITTPLENTTPLATLHMCCDLIP